MRRKRVTCCMEKLEEKRLRLRRQRTGRGGYTLSRFMRQVMRYGRFCCLVVAVAWRTVIILLHLRSWIVCFPQVHYLDSSFAFELIKVEWRFKRSEDVLRLAQGWLSWLSRWAPINHFTRAEGNTRIEGSAMTKRKRQTMKRWILGLHVLAEVFFLESLQWTHVEESIHTHLYARTKAGEESLRKVLTDHRYTFSEALRL